MVVFFFENCFYHGQWGDLELLGIYIAGIWKNRINISIFVYYFLVQGYSELRILNCSWIPALYSYIAEWNPHADADADADCGCGCGWALWMRVRMRIRIVIRIADAGANSDADCGCGSSMIDSIIHFLFTLRIRMRMRMRMRIEYELGFRIIFLLH